jgi:SAM-dependent methyltransferase
MSDLSAHLQEPELIGCPIDGPERLAAHRSVLLRKAMIRGVFEEFHQLFRRLDQRWLSGDGSVIELGAGVYPVKSTFPEVMATDFVAGPGLDRTLDAQAMDLPDASVRAFYLQNVFHHFPRPEEFLAELARVLVPGGGAILIEPFHGPLASWLYPRLFASEGFDKRAVSWRADVAGPMSGANQALSYLVFKRDWSRFQGENPRLDLVHRETLSNYVRYVASGGLNFRALLPDATIPMLRALEWTLSPLRAWFALHHAIVLRKRND